QLEFFEFHRPELSADKPDIFVRQRVFGIQVPQESVMNPKDVIANPVERPALAERFDKERLALRRQNPEEFIRTFLKADMMENGNADDLVERPIRIAQLLSYHFLKLQPVAYAVHLGATQSQIDEFFRDIKALYHGASLGQKR